MTFTIESDYKPNELNERIEAFIQWVHKYIEDMSHKDFETQKQSVITRRLEKPKQLSEYSQRLWSEISSKEYDFNRDEIEVKATKELTKQDIIAFFEVIIITFNCILIMNTFSNELMCKTETSLPLVNQS